MNICTYFLGKSFVFIRLGGVECGPWLEKVVSDGVIRSPSLSRLLGDSLTSASVATLQDKISPNREKVSYSCLLSMFGARWLMKMFLYIEVGSCRTEQKISLPSQTHANISF